MSPDHKRLVTHDSPPMPSSFVGKHYAVRRGCATARYQRCAFPVRLPSVRPRAGRRALRLRHVSQRSIQIGPKVLDGFDTNAQPQQRWRQVLLPRYVRPPFDRRLDRT